MDRNNKIRVCHPLYLRNCTSVMIFVIKILICVPPSPVCDFLQNVFSKNFIFAILQDFCKKIALLFWLYWITSFLFNSKFAEDFRCIIILNRIKMVLFGGNFYIKNFLKKFLFLFKKTLLQIIFLCPFFELKNQNEPLLSK